MAQHTHAQWLDEILTAKDEVTGPAAEVLEHLYQALMQVPEFRLSDATTATVEAYYPPTIDEEGEAHCGIDVRMGNGNLLEFTLRNTGWEKSLVQANTTSKASRGSGRSS